MKVYFISGIAADKRLFRRIRLPVEMDPVYLDWIKPFKNESISAYSIRLAEKMDTREPFILLGTSLGGIVASEMALQHPPEKLIIIGSIPVYTQLPGYYHWLANCKIHRLIPGRLYKFSARVKHSLSREEAEDKKVMIQMIVETDPAFIRWGINAVLQWRNTKIPPALIHIHGTRDEIFPYRNTSPTHSILKGDHTIIISRPDEINNILETVFSSPVDS